MDISSRISTFVSTYNITPGNREVSYEAYIEKEIANGLSASSAIYEADDMLSIIGWNTGKDCVQEVLYTSISGIMQHGIRLRYKSNHQTNPHMHKYIEIAYVVKGKLVQEIMGTQEVFYENEMCLIDSESIHTDYLLDERSTVIFLGIYPDLFTQILQHESSKLAIHDYMLKLIDHKKEKYRFIRFSPRESSVNIKKVFETLFCEMIENKPCKTSIVLGLLDRLFYLLPLEYRFELTEIEQNAMASIMFEDIEQYIDNNYQTVNVYQTAKWFNYHPDYLSKIWKAKTGSSLSQWIISVRMKQAYYLLQKSNIPISQISQKVGYNNIGFFYKKFKKKYHATPDQVRKSQSQRVN